MDKRMQLDIRQHIEALLDEGWQIREREPELILERETECKTEAQLRTVEF